MNLETVLRSVRRRINETSANNRKMILLLFIFSVSILIGVVGATVYNLMHMESEIGVEPILAFQP